MHSPTAASIRIYSHLAQGEAQDALARDGRQGLSRSPRELPPKYFYDARGSELFERITGLPEYYPTRCERAILNRRAPEIVAAARTEELVELGSGMASKSRALLSAMAGAGTLRRYVPFDVDESVVALCADELTELYPGLEVHGVVGDFEHHLELIPPGRHRLFAFLGGTIGNLYPTERAEFLARLRALLRDGDRLLLGTDLVKDEATLVAAYDDAQGVTAEFNRNVLRVLNARLGADFVPEAFEHVALFDAGASRIEMRLRATGAQTVTVPALELSVRFEDGEEILTEISTKFSLADIARELSEAGFTLASLATDEQGLFAVSVATTA